MNCSEWVKKKLVSVCQGLGLGNIVEVEDGGPGMGRIDGYWVSFEDNESVLKLDSREGYTTWCLH